MVKNSSKQPAVHLNVVLVLSLILPITIAIVESRMLAELGKAESTVSCEAVYGAEEGDTCFGVSQMFNLTANDFNEINPNLNCDTIFVGQWLCVDGSVN